MATFEHTLLHVDRPPLTMGKGFLDDRSVDFRKGGNLADDFHDLMGAKARNVRLDRFDSVFLYNHVHLSHMFAVSQRVDVHDLGEAVHQPHLVEDALVA